MAIRYPLLHDREYSRDTREISGHAKGGLLQKGKPRVLRYQNKVVETPAALFGMSITKRDGHEASTPSGRYDKE